MLFPTFPQALILSALLRGALIVYSEHHDAHSAVKYTDVDYRVYTDAARFVLNPAIENTAQGPLNLPIGNPYSRETYRYTPLLALLVTPNELIHPSFGKLVFSLCDLIVGIMLYSIFCAFPPKLAFKPPEVQRQAIMWISLLWLFNPLVFGISTRGSSESVLGLLVVGTLYLVMKGRFYLAAAIFGLSVHWKIYPIIYGPSLLAFIGVITRGKKSVHWVLDLASEQSLKFAVLSAGTFSLLTGALYLVWGYPLLWNSYLYHLGRLDHRHNFSLYFYPTYLSYPSQPQTSSNSLAISPILSFVPQMSLAIGAGILLGRKTSDLPFVWFIQTMIFVTFNKVCTSQYFIWYTWFLPLILPRLRFSVNGASMLAIVWVAAQALWLSIAYQLEFLGIQVFLPLWLASAAFLAANCWVLVKIMDAYAL